MRLAKSSRTLLPLALSAVLAACSFAQEHPNVQPDAVRGQLAKQADLSPASSPSQAPPPQTLPPAAKHSNPPAAKGHAKATAKTPAAAKEGTATSDNTDKKAVEKPEEEKPAVRRDPFDTLLTKARPGNAPPENLPPGKAGLMVETLRISGIVNSPTGTIAIVSNSQGRVYFLRDGDKLYDGSVQKITLDGITFSEIGKDAFGKPLERVVTKRLYPTPGEQQ